jgi:hypothetical protein
MDDITDPAASEKAVVLVFAVLSVALVSTLPEAVELPAVIPASRLLAEIAADRSLVSKLRTRHFQCCPGKGGVTILDDPAIRDFCDSSQGADSKTTVFPFPDAPQLFDLTEADEPFRLEDVIPQAPEKVGSTGMDQSFLHEGLLDRFLKRFRTDVGKIRHDHGFPPFRFFSSKPVSVIGLIGVEVTRIPVA